MTMEAENLVFSLCVCLCECVCEWVCAYVSAGARRVQMRVSDSLQRELYAALVSLMWCWEQNSSPLQEQPVSLTVEPSHQTF